METKINLAGTVNGSIVDGTGFRYTIFTQGCYHNCKECHNPATHDPSKGTLYNVDFLLDEIKSNPMLSGVTFSGGEPLLQSEELIPLAKEIIKLGLNIWIYTGYTFEYIMSLDDNDHKKQLVKLSQVIVDGPFVADKIDLTLNFRGSSNQRIINLKETFETGEIILLDLD